jgi:hypothetical protein
VQSRGGASRPLNAYKLFFVFHTPERAEVLGGDDKPDKLEIVDGCRLANLVIDTGLVHWLKDKTS